MNEQSKPPGAARASGICPGHAVVEGWGELPQGWDLVEAAGVAVDAHDNVHVFNRGAHPLVVFSPEGRFLRSWDEGAAGEAMRSLRRAHGITIGPDDAVYLTDDLDHAVRKYTPAGELLLTLGTSGRPSDTGATSLDYRTVRRSGPPFHYPTNLALSSAGEMYVADGYGNSRVHKFSPDGELILSWGEPGSGPGEFQVPHGIAVGGDGTVYVADRENSRIQLFSPTGGYLAEWTDVARPCQVAIGPGGDVHVAELGHRAGRWPGTGPAAPGAAGGRVSIFGRDGALRERWGGGGDPCAWGDFFAPHGIALDSRGGLYVAEVVWSAGGRSGLVPRDCHRIQKFVPLGGGGGAPVRP